MGCCLSIKSEENFDTLVPDNVTLKDCVAFVPLVTCGKVVKVYDGDSITIASKLPGLLDSPIYKFPVRLNGIDAPEMRGKNEDEKRMAKRAQEALSEKVMDKFVHLKDVKTEKYGRLLCEVYIDKLHINQWMIDQRFAVAYDGGTKHLPTSWTEYHNTGAI
jgi:micrococcal nuclease